MLDKRLLRKIDFYYKIAKLTVSPSYFTKDTRPIHYSDEGKAPTVEGISSTTQEIPLSGGRPSLSSIEDYRGYFSVTKIPYHIIFVNDIFGVTETTIGDFQKIVKNKVLEDASEEARFLLNNWDKLFSNAENSITILANEFSFQDARDPLAIDHDIGHRLLDSDSTFSLDFFQKTLDAINQDYLIQEFNFDHQNNEISKVRDLDQLEINDREVIFTILLSTFMTNNLLPNSISAKNISKSSLDDLIPDLIPYVRRGTLSSLIDKLSHIDLYFSNKPKRITTTIDSLVSHLSNLNRDTKFFKISPKNFGNIPNLKKVFTEFAKEYDTLLASKLESLKGHVISLWNV